MKNIIILVVFVLLIASCKPTVLVIEKCNCSCPNSNVIWEGNTIPSIEWDGMLTPYLQNIDTENEKN